MTRCLLEAKMKQWMKWAETCFENKELPKQDRDYLEVLIDRICNGQPLSPAQSDALYSMYKPSVTGHFCKLYGGGWGIKVFGTPLIGEEIHISKKDGGISTVTVTEIVWTGNDEVTDRVVSICRIKPERERGRERR